jgi:homoserine O-acetyltransferase/O-succinyltransferase
MRMFARDPREQGAMPLRAAAEPKLFEVALPPLQLVRGGTVRPHHARGWWWGPVADIPVLEARARPLSPWVIREPLRVVRREGPVPAIDASGAPPLRGDVPTVLAVHALSGDARVGGPGGWWEPLIGEGRPIDPSKVRILCFNNLGSCYGSSGPADEGFPADAELTSWDIARALWQALDAIGVDRLALVGGGSLGGMVALCVAALRPDKVDRLLPLASSAQASAWVVGWNHVARQILRMDPGFPNDLGRGLEMARQLAMLTYRAEPGLDLRQGRHLPLSAQAPGEYRIQGYLEHQGEKLRRRFDGRSYLQMLNAMDHHDLLLPPPGEEGMPAIARIRSSALVVDVDTDQLFTPAQVAALAGELSAAGCYVERATIPSVHGHDAFLIEEAPMAAVVRRALALPEPAR